MHMQRLMIVACSLLVLVACSGPETAPKPPKVEPAAQVQPAPTTVAEPEADMAAEPDLPQPAPEPERTVAERAMDPTEPLPEEVKAALASIESDPAPEELIRSSHYWVSNEDFHNLYKKHIDGHGGVWVGVATDQNYLMAAWAKSPVLIMMDFDLQIRNVHELYGIIFRRVETASELRKAWKNTEQMHTWIEEDYKDKRKIKALKKTFKKSNASIRARLRYVVKVYKERKIPTFLTDETQFAYIRDLWRNGRVIAIRGDLTGDKTMLSISKALESVGLTVGLLYTSNAEQYFDFTPEYRRNVAALPSDEKSLVLRTRPNPKLGVPEGGEYHYNVQPLANLQQWLKVSRAKKVSWLLFRNRVDDEEILGLSQIIEDAKVSKRPPKVAKMPEET